jgi:sulfate adenylyltransferase
LETIAPHGGKLINRLAEIEQYEVLEESAKKMSKITLNKREVSDLDLIAVGAYSPLEGFMVRKDYENVLQNKRLANGLPWTIPVTLTVCEKSKDLKPGADIALANSLGEIMAVLHLEDFFKIDAEKEALMVYGTRDIEHPGVKYLFGCGIYALGGKVTVLKRPRYTEFNEYRYDPAQSRKLFKEKGWKRVVGFQTRNPVHRAHEYIQKCALEVVDGLFLHPLIGETKEGDISADIRMNCYEVLLENYYPKDRVVLGVLPAAMRYAGPREAIFHAILRKNYGCTHFIVGRDHAGVGNYYGSFDAHYIFDEFEPDELGIVPMFFDYTFYCRGCNEMASYKTCPHDSKMHVALSGTKVREMLRAGEMPPEEFTRPEVAKVLIESMAGNKGK